MTADHAGSAFSRVIAARRLHDVQGADKRPLAIAVMEWARAEGIEPLMESEYRRDLDELLRAVRALADASVAPVSRDRSPARAARMQAAAWERIEAVAGRRR